MATAGALWAWATAVLIVDGPPAFAANRTGYLEVILLCLVAGAATSAVVEVVRPLLRTSLGAVVAGYLAAVPVTLAVRIAVAGLTPWTLGDTVLLAVEPLIGAMIAFSLRRGVP